MQKLARRDVLRGTGVAALVAGAAVVPALALDPRQRVEQLMGELRAATLALYPDDKGTTGHHCPELNCVFLVRR